MGFKNDNGARIPFVVVGIFLLIGSTIISGIIIEIESFESKELVKPSEMENLDKMMTIMRNDMAAALNMAGMRAMDYAGKHPVVIPNMNSKAARIYSCGKLENHTGEWSYEERQLFNENWIKNMIKEWFNQYIESNYMNDSYNNGEYSINAHYIENWSEIKVKKIYMKIDRRNSLIRLFTHSDEEFPVYWKVSLPLRIEIKNMEGGKIVDKKSIKIESIITSRYPLMQKLMENFEKSITDERLSHNELFMLFTLLSQSYTEARSLLQYGGLYEKIPNIVDNRWLCYLINSAILLDEFILFSSIDPISSIYLLLHWKDLASYGFPEKRKAIELFENGENEKAKFQDALQTITDNEEKKMSYRKMMDLSRKNRISIAKIAESILYKTDSLYIYYNESYGVFHNLSKFEGYEIEYKGKHYNYVPPPPYCYYNVTKGEKIFENIYRGKTIYENGSVYFIQYRNESFVSIKRGVNEDIEREIEDKINKSYTANFSITVERKVIGKPYYQPNITGYWNCKKREGNWTLYEVKNITPVKNITSLPHTEEWELEWHKDVIYGHKKPVYDDGHFIGFLCDGEKHFTYIKKERVMFFINAKHPKVNNIFNQTDITLMTSRHDNNLFYMLRDFVKNVFNPFRENTLRKYGKNGSKIVAIPEKGKNMYAMQWLRGENGEVMKALQEILDKIKHDDTVVELNENRGINATVDDICDQLLQKYRAKKDEYIEENRYISNGMYKSCSALVVEKMREWYVEEIENRIKKAAVDMKNRIKNEIDKKLKGKIEFGEIQKVRSNMPDIDLDSIPVQFGLTIQLENSSLHWKEKLGFSIDQSPDYFNPNNQLFISNICLFGPSGLPLLPSPITPWIITTNAWYIHVEGKFSKFEITDTVGKMRPSMLFGGTDFSYIREADENGENKPVIDPITGEIIGWNAPISFSIDTLNIGITPPGFFGDKNPSSYPIEKDGQVIGNG